jgi:Protein of unknown function (DUF3102)
MKRDPSNIVTAEINAYQRVAGEAIFEIGRRLKHVKENDLVHGEWSKWCESIGMDRTNAHRFIKVYNELGDENVDTWQQIGIRALYEIVQIHPNQRTQPHTVPSTGATKTVDEMTVREIREVKKALRQAEEDARTLGQLLTEERNKPPEVEYVTDPTTEAKLERYEDKKTTRTIVTDFTQVQ